MEVERAADFERVPMFIYGPPKRKKIGNNEKTIGMCNSYV